ncbi:hypothetical protein HMSSN139_44830 [Paenibacillus sp. HMSSN-139]|nr:hypothetical protein HMSSN139_44830 [Paenibacillus sp. HMSSN-139]
MVNFFVASLPEDGVPPWDFRATPEAGDDGIPRDTSAGAIAASGLLELADLLEDPVGRPYRAAAERMLRSLAAKYATWDDPGHEAILVQGTGHKPANQNVNVFADLRRLLLCGGLCQAQRVEPAHFLIANHEFQPEGPQGPFGLFALDGSSAARLPLLSIELNFLSIGFCRGETL